MAAARPSNPDVIESKVLSTNIQHLQGVYYSQKRDEIYVVDESQLFSFQERHGSKSGIYHHISGQKRTESARRPWYADGMAQRAQFDFQNVSISFCEADSGALLISDPRSGAIRAVDLSDNSVSSIISSVDTVSGSVFSLRDKDALVFPMGICFDSQSRLIVADYGSHRIIRFTLRHKTFETIGGQYKTFGFYDGPAHVSLFHMPISVSSIAGFGLVIADKGNRRVRGILEDGNAVTIAGSGILGTQDGPCMSARFSDIQGVCANYRGDILVSDTQRIRMIKNGFVSTFWNAKGRVNKMTGFSVNSVGDLIWCYRLALSKLVTSSEFKQHWNAERRNSTRLSFSELLNLEDASSSSQFSQISIPLPKLSTTLSFPASFLAVRCPKLLEAATQERIQSLPVSASSMDILMSYLYDDSIQKLNSAENLNFVEVGALAQVTELVALQEYCLWRIFMFALRGDDAGDLVRCLVAAVNVTLEPAINDLMRAIVTHNNSFTDLKHMATLKASLPEARRTELKDLLQRNKILESVRLRTHTQHLLTGSMATQLETLLQASLDGNPIESDIRLICSKNRKRFAIPCHTFVLYARWLYVRPIFKHSFKEAQKGELEMLTPDGVLFDFEWARHFLAFLYYGDNSIISNPDLAETTRQYADYLLLNPTDPSPPPAADHSWITTIISLRQHLKEYSVNTEGAIEGEEVSSEAPQN